MEKQQLLIITPQLSINVNEIDIQAIRAQGAGGQHVNKVSTAIHLRFNILASSLPEQIQQLILSREHHLKNQDGVINIKSQSSRSQNENRQQAILRLVDILQKLMIVQKKRKPTRPSQASRLRRLVSKKRQSELKQQRRHCPSE